MQSLGAGGGSSVGQIQQALRTNDLTYSYRVAVNPGRSVTTTSYASVTGTQYYCDPVNGKHSNDGKSESSPWPGLQVIVDANYFKDTFVPGDVINLMPGQHGSVDLQDAIYTDYVTIRGCSGWRARLQMFKLAKCSHMVLEGVRVTPCPNDQDLSWRPPSVNGSGLIRIQARQGTGSDHIIISLCKVYTTYSAWRLWKIPEWNHLTSDGIKVIDSSNCTVDRCEVWNVGDSVYCSASNCTFSNNWVHDFNGDGFKGGGPSWVITGNLVTDLWDTSGYHSDAIQMAYGSAANPPVLSGWVVRNNLIIAQYTFGRGGLPASCQGISNFFNVVDGAIIENNLVFVDRTYHGLSIFYGGSDEPYAINSRIVNNTFYGDQLPWIKLGGNSTNNVIRNNIACEYQVDGTNTMDHNIEITSETDAKRYFQDPTRNLYRIIAGSPSIDAGHPSDYTATDFEGDTRPNGSFADVGAEEYN